MITSKILNYHLGRPGDAGIDGINGTDITNVGLSKVQNPICSLFNAGKVAELANGQLVITRDSDSFYLDDYGVGQWALSDTLFNYAENSWDATDWGDVNAGAWTEFQSGQLDPDGGNLASTIQLQMNTVSLPDTIIRVNLGVVPDDKNLTVQFWAQLGTPSDVIQSIDVALGDSTTATTEAKLATSENLTTAWQFFEVTFSSMSTVPTHLYINPRATSGTFIEITFVGLSGSNKSVPRIDTDGAIDSITNPSNETRLNKKGLLIEGPSNNQCLDSQNLNGSSWSVINGSVTFSQLLTPAPDGKLRDNVVITSNGLDDITIRCTNPLLVDTSTYVVSMYSQQLSGFSGDITTNVGGGTNELFNEIPNANGFNRIHATVTSSSAGHIDINIPTPQNGYQIALWGVQCELDSLTSYIRNGDTEVGRGDQFVTLPFDSNFIPTNLNWSLLFSQGDIQSPVIGVNRTVIDNSGVGADLFRAYYSDSSDDLIVDNGTMSLTITDARLGTYIAITFDGSLMSSYIDGVAGPTTSTGTASIFTGTNVYVGSQLLDNHINSELNIQLFDTTLNADEINYLSGVINAS